VRKIQGLSAVIAASGVVASIGAGSQPLHEGILERQVHIYIPGSTCYTSRALKRRTTIEIDDGLVEEAREVLGTRGLRDTVEAALTEAVRTARRRELADQLASTEGLDRDALLEARRSWQG
jgi:Arc/MetJ family transcription regulator